MRAVVLRHEVEVVGFGRGEHRVHDSDVEYILADPGELRKVTMASEFSCPGCGTEFAVTAAVKEVLVEGGDPE